MKRAVRTNLGWIEYTLIQTVRSNVLFKVLPEGVTHVYAPKFISLRAVDELVRSNASSILEMRAKLNQKLNEEAANRQHLREGALIAVEGTRYPLRLHAGTDAMYITGGELHLYTPDPENAQGVRASLKSELARLALERIRQRLNVYAPRVDGVYHRVTIREQKTRWGSCSSKHNLNFNWMLIMAPPQVLDYVVIHELCHLHELNHSQRFWALVREQMPDYEVWKKWLKAHGRELGI